MNKSKIEKIFTKTKVKAFPLATVESRKKSMGIICNTVNIPGKLFQKNEKILAFMGTVTCES